MPTEKTMTSYLQLMYWNRVLLNQGLITEREFYLMAEQIRKRYSVD